MTITRTRARVARSFGLARPPAFLVLCLLLYLVLVSRVVATRDYWPRYDSGAFISGAVALHQGIGFRDITAPVSTPATGWATRPIWVEWTRGADTTGYWPAYSQYPPLLPVLLVPLISLGSGRYLALQALPLLCGIASTLLLYRWRAELFGRQWRPVLLLTTISISTLFATRVQSEAVQLPLMIVALWCTARAQRHADRFLRWSAASALVFAVLVAIHTKIFFVPAGLAAWALVGVRVRWWKRLAAAALFVGLSVLPAIAWNFLVGWRGLFDTGGLDALHNPFMYRASGPGDFVVGAGRSMVSLYAGRFANTFVQTFLGIATPTWRMFVEQPAHAGVRTFVGIGAAVAAPFMLIGLASCLVRGFRGAAAGGSASAATAAPLPIAFGTAAYIGGTTLSPWFEPRMTVPVQPFVIAMLVVGLWKVSFWLHGLVGSVGERSLTPRSQAADPDVPRADRLSTQPPGAKDSAWPWIPVLALSAMSAVSWVRFPATVDEFAAQHYLRRPAYTASLRVATAFPETSVFIVAEDNDAYALATGRATISSTQGEWKMSNPRRFLAAGGRAIAVGWLGAVRSWDTGASIEVLRDVSQAAAVPVAAVNVHNPAPGTQPPGPGFSIDRIHPRWLRLGPADASALWSAALPARR